MRFLHRPPKPPMPRNLITVHSVLVPLEGVEPPHLSILEPKSSASTNFATEALSGSDGRNRTFYKNLMRIPRHQSASSPEYYDLDYPVIYNTGWRQSQGFTKPISSPRVQGVHFRHARYPAKSGPTTCCGSSQVQSLLMICIPFSCSMRRR